MRPYKATNSKNPVVTIDFVHNGEKIPVSFQLADKGNQWKIRNINVSGIDLGLQFRNQFAANVKRNGAILIKPLQPLSQMQKLRLKRKNRLGVA